MAAEFYKAVRNSIVDGTGKQIAVVLPSNCTMKLAREMAAYAAQQANHAARQRESTDGVPVAHGETFPHQTPMEDTSSGKTVGEG